MSSVLSTPSDRRALHALNGQMIQHLTEMLPDCRWNEWIVNVIILHRAVGVVETATLETSATLWHGDEYFSAEDCDPFKRTKPRMNPGDPLSVRSLDGRVPLHDSFAGLCIRSGNVIWIDDLKTLQDSITNPLKNVYRSFGYVGVESTALADAEYVFPIRLRAGLTDITWGVLNCEWYRPRDRFSDGSRASPFQRAGLGRDVVVDLVIDLLELHGRYLPVVLYEDGLKQDCTSRLSACYQEMFELHKHAKGSSDEARQHS